MFCSKVKKIPRRTRKGSLLDHLFNFLPDLLEHPESPRHLIVAQTLLSLHDTGFNGKSQIRCESRFVYLHFFGEFISMVVEPYDHFIQFLFGIRFFFSAMIYKFMSISTKITKIFTYTHLR